ncbi:MAG: transglutaminase domain-containing protein [Saprospiraceae bacterium]
MNSTKLFLLLLTHLFVCQIFGQSDFSKVDQYARDTPSSQAQSIEKLAAHLTSKFKTETESVRAIYVWMAENIRYNHHVIDNGNISIEQRLKKEKPEKVLKAKWAVCEGYSNLFHALCQEAGIACEVVTGIVKDQNGKIPAIGHAWNVVRVDGGWHPIDVTWGAGGLSGDNNKFVKNFKDDYFLTDPAVFIQNHYPHDPLFQLLETPL